MTGLLLREMQIKKDVTEFRYILFSFCPLPGNGREYYSNRTAVQTATDYR